jgi:6-phosphofructokinase 1
MCDFVRSSPVDLDEAYRCGVEAVKLSGKGESGVMVSIKRTSNNPYTIEFGKVPLKEVAVSAKPMSPEFFNAEGNHVSQKFIDYIKPLAGELPEFIQLEKLFAKSK